ncbi:MAG: hypothetical protein WC332_00095 [Clostridia bacterium]|jgi:hypothetical protein
MSWIYQHPIMTFFLILVALFVIDNIGCNIANAIAHKTNATKDSTEKP